LGLNVCNHALAYFGGFDGIAGPKSNFAYRNAVISIVKTVTGQSENRPNDIKAVLMKVFRAVLMWSECSRFIKLAKLRNVLIIKANKMRHFSSLF
jgi:hypothetical protein